MNPIRAEIEDGAASDLLATCAFGARCRWPSIANAMLQNVFGTTRAARAWAVPDDGGVRRQHASHPRRTTRPPRRRCSTRPGGGSGADGMRTKNGRPLRFSLIVLNSSLYRRRYAVLLQEQFRKIGVQVDVEQIDRTRQFSQRRIAGDFDTMLWTDSTRPESVRHRTELGDVRDRRRRTELLALLESEGRRAARQRDDVVRPGEDEDDTRRAPFRRSSTTCRRSGSMTCRSSTPSNRRINVAPYALRRMVGEPRRLVDSRRTSASTAIASDSRRRNPESVRRHLVARLGQSLIVVVIVTTISFFVIRTAPGDPFSYDGRERSRPRFASIGASSSATTGRCPNSSSATSEASRTGELGYSFTQTRAGVRALAEAIPRTLLLVGVALALSVLLGVIIGVLQATRRNSWFDRVSSAVLLSFYSLPDFWAALMIVADLRVLVARASGRTTWSIRSCTTTWARGTRSSIGFNISFSRLRRSRCSRWRRSHAINARRCSRFCRPTTSARRARRACRNARSIWRHALRNALTPMVTLLGLLLPGAPRRRVVRRESFLMAGHGPSRGRRDRRARLRSRHGDGDRRIGDGRRRQPARRPAAHGDRSARS